MRDKNTGCILSDEHAPGDVCTSIKSHSKMRDDERQEDCGLIQLRNSVLYYFPSLHALTTSSSTIIELFSEVSFDGSYPAL